MVLGLFAGAATLTRSIIIAMIIGWVTFIILYLHYQLHIAPHSLKKLIKHFCLYMTAICVAILLISLIPKIHSLEQGLLSRFLYHPSSTSIDYSNGRIYDEWIPALTAWTNSDMLGLIFGIGAGTTFTVATGEERTYIHNLVIYSLVYGGIYGLLSCLWLYFTIFKTLIYRASQASQIIYLGFAALLASIFAYAQLFAVHKGLAFNAMLFLMIALALSQPVSRKVKSVDDGIY